MSKEKKLNITHKFVTSADITERTIKVAEAFGLGIDEEKTFPIYDNFKLDYRLGDVIYITGDSGSGKSWLLKNVFLKLENSISIDDITVDDDELIVEGVGEDLNEALQILNLAGLSDAFLYLRRYNQLSDGQRYRYKIAKFIDNKDKDIWILDEFCATLDRVTAKVVANNIQKIARRLNKTLICATTHKDLLYELKPDLLILKGYEADVKSKRFDKEYWNKKKLFVYSDLKVERGETEDYEKLKRFHYRQSTLGAVKQVYKLLYKDKLIGAMVICYPHLALKGRNIYTNKKYAKMTSEICKQINKDFDYISRVVILPKYRGLGLAQYFLKEYFKMTDAKYVETLAVMANYNPFFAKAGMTRVDVDVTTKREKMVKELEDYGFNISLLSSKRYVEDVYNKLEQEEKEAVNEIMLNIIDKYKGATKVLFSKLRDKEDWKQYLRENTDELLEFCKHLRRANTVYFIKEIER